MSIKIDYSPNPVNKIIFYCMFSMFVESLTVSTKLYILICYFFKGEGVKGDTSVMF